MKTGGSGCRVEIRRFERLKSPIVLNNRGKAQLDIPSKLLAVFGGRGRNRTYNLSVKSRMLCQLSYASIGSVKPCCGGLCAQPAKGENSPCHLKNIAQSALNMKGVRGTATALYAFMASASQQGVLKAESQATAHAALRLSEDEHRAIGK